MKFTKVDSIEDANYWIPKENTRHENLLILDKPYKIHYDKCKDAYYIIDESGREAAYYIGFRGDFVK